MKDVCEVRELTENDNHKSIKEQVFPNAINGKGKILDYLRSFPAKCVLASTVIDEITGEDTGQDLQLYEDNDWTWDDSVIYHFEHYNMRLSEEFLDYVLSK